MSEIYQLNIGADTYIGSTRNFTDRIGRHMRNSFNPNSTKYNYKISKAIREANGEMTADILYVLEPDEQLLRLEMEFYKALRPTLNTYAPMSELNYSRE
tara:strand:+ start:1712 stop:2008 length:297 start_codon:yes stop_codon:yes gene_type:complete